MNLKETILFSISIGASESDIFMLGNHKEVRGALMELMKEGKIYPEVLDYGKMEQSWSIKKVEN